MAGGAPVGNQNAVKGKLVEQALRKAALADDSVRLRKGCEKLMDAFEVGEPWALQLVFDRLDGKASQPLTGADGGAILIGGDVHFVASPTS